MLQEPCAPEHPAVVPFSRAMIVQPAFDPAPIDPSRRCSTIEAQVARFEPVPNRTAKSLFWPVNQLIRDQTPDRSFEEKFGDSAAQFVAGWDSAREIDDIDVQERRPYFEPVDHACAINLDQDVILEIEPDKELNCAINVVFCGRMIPCGDRFRIERFRIRFFVEKFSNFLKVERPHPGWQPVLLRKTQAPECSLESEIETHICVRHRESFRC